MENMTVTHRVASLRGVPAAVRLLSCEPLLGPLNATGPDRHGMGGRRRRVRPCHRRVELAWVRGVRDTCLAQAVPLFFKLWGGRTPKANAVDGKLWDEMPGGQGPVLGARQAFRGPLRRCEEGAAPPGRRGGCCDRRATLRV